MEKKIIDTIDQTIIGDILKSVHGRLRNLFMSSFIISWISFNWKWLALLLFSDKNIDELISHIDNFHISIWYTAVIPFIVASCVAIGLPYLLNAFEDWTRDSRLKTIDMHHEREEHQLDKEIKYAKKLADLQREKNGIKDRELMNATFERLEREKHEIRTELEASKNQIGKMKKQKDQLDAAIFESTSNAQTFSTHGKYHNWLAQYGAGQTFWDASEDFFKSLNKDDIFFSYLNSINAPFTNWDEINSSDLKRLIASKLVNKYDDGSPFWTNRALAFASIYSFKLRKGFIEA